MSIASRNQVDGYRKFGLIVVYGIVTGAVGGFGAWLFRTMIALVHNLAFLGRLDMTYDANMHTPASPWGFGIVLVPVLGAIVVVYLVKHFAPEAKGHGVPEVMDAIHYQSGIIRPAVAVVKAAASAVSIGSGGSVGREGPIVQIGAAFGSTLGQFGRLSSDDLNLLISTGAAAGIAATFNAPLGGLFFAVELLLVTVSPRSILVVGAGVVSGIAVGRAFVGSGLAFDVPNLESVNAAPMGWIDAAALAVLAVGIGGLSVLLIRGMYWTEDVFETRFRNPYVGHASGMAALGLGMYGMYLWLGNYTIQGLGYATLNDVLMGVTARPWLLLVLAAAKWAATSVTLGSGASGGIFSPSLFVGAALGGAAGHALANAGVAVDPTLFILGGMAAAVAANTGAAFTAVTMVTEMTGDFGAAMPILLVVAIAGASRDLLWPNTIYTEKLIRRGHPVPVQLERRLLRQPDAGNDTVQL